MKTEEVRLECGVEVQNLFNAIIYFRFISILHVIFLIGLGYYKNPQLVNYLSIPVGLVYTFAVLRFRSEIFSKSTDRKLFFIIFITIDLIFNLIMQTANGGWESGWYYYSFHTIFAAVLLTSFSSTFGIATALSYVYFFSLLLNNFSFNHYLQNHQLYMVINNIFNYYLVAIFFAYPAILIKGLRKTKKQLETKTNALKSTKDAIDHLKNHSMDIEHAICILLKPENILRIIQDNRDIVGNHTNENGQKSVELESGESLTKKEREVLALMADGLSVKELAAKLKSSISTVNSHRQNIYKKFGVCTFAQAVNKATSKNMLID